MQVRDVGVGVVLMCAGCAQEDAFAWIRFNGEGDALEVAITTSPAGEGVVTRDLLSTTGSAIIGAATCAPCDGPVGTVHHLQVDLDRAHEDRVGRVDVRVVSPERGEGVFELVQDSAQLWRWVLDLSTLGVDGEARTDTLTFELYELVEVEPEDDGKGLFGF